MVHGVKVGDLYSMPSALCSVLLATVSYLLASETWRLASIVIFVISVIETHPHKGFRSYVTLHSNSRVIKGKIFCENSRLE
jgi:hypothetical protein